MHERTQIIVYFKTPKVLKRVKKVGNITYYHKKRRYAVVYIDTQDAESTIASLNELRHVKSVDYSRIAFEDALVGDDANDHEDSTPERTTDDIANDLQEENASENKS